MCDASTKELQQLAEKHEEQLNEMRDLQQQLSVRTLLHLNLSSDCNEYENVSISFVLNATCT